MTRKSGQKGLAKISGSFIFFVFAHFCPKKWALCPFFPKKVGRENCEKMPVLGYFWPFFGYFCSFFTFLRYFWRKISGLCPLFRKMLLFYFKNFFRVLKRFKRKSGQMGRDRFFTIFVANRTTFWYDGTRYILEVFTMAISLISAQCPSCGGSINVESGHDSVFCPYCGTKVLIHDDTVHTYRVIDEAEIQRVKSEEAIKKMEMEDKAREDKEEHKQLYAILGLAVLVFVLMSVFLLLSR